MYARFDDVQRERRRAFWRGVGVATAALIVAQGFGLVFGLFLR